MAKLIILRGGQHRVMDLKGTIVSIGRAADNDLAFDDPSMSRRHCELRFASGQWFARDNGSFNGTFLNDLSCQNQLLRSGDRLLVGTTVFYFIGDGAGGDSAVDSGERVAQERATHEALSRKLRNFMSLLEITKAVSSELSRERLLTIVVQKSIELVSAERGFLILLEGGEPSFEVALTASGEPVTDPRAAISTSVLESVTTKGEPVITINAQQDLGGFMSIVALEVRSLICVPLKGKDRILGCLYVDSQVSSREFTDESLNLLHAFADQAAIALENASLYDAVVEAKEEEKRIRTVFQRYVPKDVVDEVLHVSLGGEGLRSKKVTATVLFSDIRSFTSTSERLQPEAVVDFLNDYLQRMVDIVFDEGGIVDKFVGDAVMAVWGAPITKADDARRGVRAALRMLEEVERFNADQRAKGGVEIEIGIGLHTGQLIAGNMGSDKKMEYTVIGDTVNVASRVEGLNKRLKTQLLITRETKDAVGPGLEVREMPPVEVKGKKEKLIVFEPLPASSLGEPARVALAAGDVAKEPTSPDAMTKPFMGAVVPDPDPERGAPPRRGDANLDIQF